MKDGVLPKGVEHSALLHALARKRAELAGEVAAHEGALRRLSRLITNLDETIGPLNPDVRVEKIRPKRAIPPYVAGYGMMTSTVIGALHDAGHPLTSREIALRYLDRFDLDAEDQALVALISKRVRSCLKTLRAQGRACALPAKNGPQEWTTAHQACQPSGAG